MLIHDSGLLFWPLYIALVFLAFAQTLLYCVSFLR